MARSRPLKPSFFKNEDLAELSPLTRLLFTGLWTIADREGRLEDRPRKIKAEVLPYDECDIDAMLAQLAECGSLLRYEVNKVACIQVTSWPKHGAPHPKEPPSELPAPPESGDAVINRDLSRKDTAEPRLIRSSSSSGSSGFNSNSKTEEEDDDARKRDFSSVSMGEDQDRPDEARLATAAAAYEQRFGPPTTDQRADLAQMVARYGDAEIERALHEAGLTKPSRPTRYMRRVLEQPPGQRARASPKNGRTRLPISEVNRLYNTGQIDVQEYRHLKEQLGSRPNK